MNPRLVPPARLARSVLRTQTDERLCELISSGSDAAFEALVARHRRDLVRHCARIVGDDAEEAVQEALVRAHNALSRGAQVQRAAPWLRVIAHNAALNLLRARASRAETCPVDAVTEPGREDHAAEQRLELSELVAAVGALPDRQRDAIVMRELEGRSYAEIAQRLDATPGAVRQLLSRARTTVRARLAGLVPVDLILRWLPTAPAGTAGSRLGALSDGCVVTVKLCAALIPAAAIGAGVAGNLSGGTAHHAAVTRIAGVSHSRRRHTSGVHAITAPSVARTSAGAAGSSVTASAPVVTRVSYVSARLPAATGSTGATGSTASTAGTTAAAAAGPRRTGSLIASRAAGSASRPASASGSASGLSPSASAPRGGGSASCSPTSSTEPANSTASTSSAANSGPRYEATRSAPSASGAPTSGASAPSTGAPSGWSSNSGSGTGASMTPDTATSPMAATGPSPAPS